MAYEPLDIQKTYLVTGAAGFIGSFLSGCLLEKGCKVVGIDNMNAYYDAALKQERLNLLAGHAQFNFIEGDISDKRTVNQLFEEHRPHFVINLAAQAGVRYSIDNPDAYIESNIIGFYNILEACRFHPIDHLVYASSSSVYGANKKVPFEETDPVDHPISLYAATKKSNELMAHTYSHLYGIPTTGLRFFTVYGPMGRPDMAYFSFTKAFFAEESIQIFNNGDFNNDLYRDFTYIDDIVQGVVRLLPIPPIKGEGVPHRIFNIGNSKPIKLMQFIATLEKCLSKAVGYKVEFEKKFEPMKPGDVPATFASTALLEQAIGFKPETSMEEGLQKFADWYCVYYGVVNADKM